MKRDVPLYDRILAQNSTKQCTRETNHKVGMRFQKKFYFFFLKTIPLYDLSPWYIVLHYFGPKSDRKVDTPAERIPSLAHCLYLFGTWGRL